MDRIIDIYNHMLNEDNGEKVIYYKTNLVHNTFDELDFSDIKKYFERGGKNNACISKELEDYFSASQRKDETDRVKHMFSIYLFGIYCYDHIKPINDAFNNLIENKIWKNTKENGIPNKDERLRDDFLYLWFLTALYHDMGYVYESKGDNDNSLYSFIIERKSMMSNDNLGFQPVSGIPRNIQLAAKEYFWHKRNNILFYEHLCTDHGFAGGVNLYATLKKLHQEKSDESSRPVDTGGLLFGRSIFQWYNVPSVWAIICHNIWLAEGGTGRATKYEALGLDKLIYFKGKSPIKLKDHPLLFLLDFVDTVDPYKRFETSCDGIFISCNDNELSLSLDHGCSASCVSCKYEETTLSCLSSDLDYLKSSNFQVNVADNTITFSF